MKTIIEISIAEHQKALNAVQDELSSAIMIAARMIASVVSSGNKLLIMGNGGSAADAQHFAAELVGRFEKERHALPAIALTTDTSCLTAIGNDYGFNTIFARQVQALAKKGDLVVGISTSGNSENVRLALEKAAEIGCQTVALLGRDGGSIKDLADLSLTVPVERTARVQEMHLLMIHLLCELIEAKL